MRSSSRDIGLGVRGSLVLFVALLILCQFFYVLVMWIFWRETKLELRRQLRAKEVVEQVELIRLKEKELLIEAMESKARTGVAKIRPASPPDYFRQKTVDFRTLSPKMIGLNEQLVRVAIELDTACGRLSNAATASESDRHMKSVREAIGAMDDLLDDMRNRFKDFRREHAEKLMLANTVDFVYLGLVFVLVLVIVVVITMVFAHVIERRISTLVRNTELAAKGVELLPPLRGKDEFAAVDGAFRRMTIALREESENLRLSETKTRMIVESLPVGLMLALPGGEIEAGNHAAAQLLGVKDPSLLVGEKIDRFFQGELDRCNTTESKTIDVCKSDGQQFPSEVLRKNYESVDGERMLIIFADISDREKIRKLREEFVAVVSHEIRTPLTAIRAFLKLLRDSHFGQLNDEGRGAVRQMDSVTKKVIALVNDLVDAGKIELGYFNLDVKPASLASMVEAAADSVAALAEQHGVLLELPSDDIQVLADEERTTQVLINLLSNAVKYSPSGETVFVHLSEAGGLAMVSVEDHGIGVPSEHVTEIFNRFGQIAGESHKRKESSGLGLYISKDIVEKQGGSIGVKESLQGGATFWFTVPLAS